MLLKSMTLIKRVFINTKTLKLFEVCLVNDSKKYYVELYNNHLPIYKSDLMNKIKALKLFDKKVKEELNQIQLKLKI